MNYHFLVCDDGIAIPEKPAIPKKRALYLNINKATYFPADEYSPQLRARLAEEGVEPRAEYTARVPQESIRIEIEGNAKNFSLLSDRDKKSISKRITPILDLATMHDEDTEAEYSWSQDRHNGVGTIILTTPADPALRIEVTSKGKRGTSCQEVHITATNLNPDTTRIVDGGCKIPTYIDPHSHRPRTSSNIECELDTYNANEP